VVGDDPADSRVDVRIGMASVDTGFDQRDEHLRSPDFFDVWHASDPWGGERAVFSARTEIDREDWGLTWNMVLESGGILVSRKIQIEIEAEAVFQPAGQ
jgi:polyisoprenoid-binding protein YceI